MGILGVDVSNNNGNLDLTVLPPKPSFVLAKATEGTTFEDPKFHTFMDQATAGLKVHFGAYHFFHAENLNARAQAEFFCKIATPRSHMSLWLDYETYGVNGETDAEEIGLFIDEVKVEFPKAKVGIYCNETGYNRIKPYFNEIPFNGLWFANPSTPPTTQGVDSIYWQIHQYATNDGIDMDYWAWDLQKVQSYYTW